MSRNVGAARDRSIKNASDDQVREELNRSLRQLVVGNPAFAVAALEAQGWRVWPPKGEKKQASDPDA